MIDRLFGGDTLVATTRALDASSLRQQVTWPVDRDAVLGALLHAVGPRVDALDHAAGRRRQGSEFRARCTTVGAGVRVELADRVFEGTAIDVTSEGHLVVASGARTETVIAGDVVHVRPGPGLPVPGRGPIFHD